MAINFERQDHNCKLLLKKYKSAVIALKRLHLYAKIDFDLVPHSPGHNSKRSEVLLEKRQQKRKIKERKSANATQKSKSICFKHAPVQIKIEQSNRVEKPP